MAKHSSADNGEELLPQDDFTNVSGGVAISASSTDIEGDVIGRDKVIVLHLSDTAISWPKLVRFPVRIWQLLSRLRPLLATDVWKVLVQLRPLEETDLEGAEVFANLDVEAIEQELQSLLRIGPSSLGVPAGPPRIGEEGTKNVDELYDMDVEGDSMIGAGIRPGDRIRVKGQAYAENGDIVVARFRDTGGRTLKRLRYDSGDPKRYWLEPANPKYPPIPVGKNEIDIEAVYVGKARPLPGGRVFD